MPVRQKNQSSATKRSSRGSFGETNSVHRDLQAPGYRKKPKFHQTCQFWCFVMLATMGGCWAYLVQ